MLPIENLNRIYCLDYISKYMRNRAQIKKEVIHVIIIIIDNTKVEYGIITICFI